MPLFSQDRTWEKVLKLMLAAIICPAKRTITACLRVMGHNDDESFSNYHHILNRVKWSTLQGSRILLGILIRTFAPFFSDKFVFAIDEHLERRRGDRIKAKGCYRDAVRSSKSYVVKCFGLKWICLSLIVFVPWSKRAFALPFMTVLAPSKACNEKEGKQHKTTIDWAGQMICIMSKWMQKIDPTKTISLVGDGAYACVHFAWQCMTRKIRLITRFRLDSALYATLDPNRPKKRGRPALKGEKVCSLKQRSTDTSFTWETLSVNWYGQVQKAIEYQTDVNLWYTPGEKPIPVRWVMIKTDQRIEALMCTDINYSVQSIIEDYVLRWNLEVTFEEARAHMGIETQRQYSDLAINRTTPCLMGLYSLVIVAGDVLNQDHEIHPQKSAWYQKEHVTFLDILKVVRGEIIVHTNFLNSSGTFDLDKFKDLKTHPIWNILAEWAA